MKEKEIVIPVIKAQNSHEQAISDEIGSNVDSPYVQSNKIHSIKKIKIKK